MRNFIPAILCVLVIAACNQSPSGPGDEFESRQVGNFLITSPTTAKWIGEQSPQKRKVDTLEIAQPLQFGLSIEVDTTTLRWDIFKITYVDSTSIGYPEVNELDIKVKPEQEFYRVAKGGGTRIHTDKIEFERRLNYQCQHNGDPISDVEIHYLNEDSLLQVVVLKASGFENVLDDFRRCGN